MKCSKLSFVFLVVAQLSVALFVPGSNGIVARQNNKFSGNRGNNQNGGNNNKNGGNNNQNGGNNNQTSGNNNQTSGNNNQTSGNNNQTSGNNNQTSGNNDNPQTSTTLDPSVIQNINGKGQAAGESDSLVSTNNFINFCIGKTLTNGKQVQGGSCNPTPMGDIPSTSNMPSVKFANPPNGANVQANTEFTVVMNIQGMQTGVFTNADNTYFGAPQQLNSGGQVIGHNHVVIEAIDSPSSTQPTNPSVFAFFKGLNDAASGGQLTADVTKGLPAGAYRMCSITTAANHQAVLVPVAQRGTLDDCSYFTVGGNGGDSTSSGGGNNANGGNSTSTNGGNNNNGGNSTNTDGGNNNGGNNNNGGQNSKNGGRKGGRNGRRYERRFFTWN